MSRWSMDVDLYTFLFMCGEVMLCLNNRVMQQDITYNELDV